MILILVLRSRQTSRTWSQREADMSNLALHYTVRQDPTLEKHKIEFSIKLVKRDFDKEFDAFGYHSFISNELNNKTITEIQAKLLQLIHFTCSRTGSYCFISQGHMAEIIGYTRATVNRNLKKLEQLKLIRVVGDHLYTSRYEYRIVITNCYITKWGNPSLIKNDGVAIVDKGREPPPRQSKKQQEVTANQTVGTLSELHKEKVIFSLPIGKKNISLPTKQSDFNQTKTASRFKSTISPCERTENRDIHQTKVNGNGFNTCFNNESNNYPHGKVKNIHGFNNRFNKQSTSQSCNDVAARQNNCLRDTSMGFFAELETTKSNSRFTDFDYAAAKRLRKAIIDGKFIFSRPGSLDSWANEFYLLRKSEKEEVINKVLDWYIKNIGGEYIPQAFSAAAFRKKFAAIMMSCNRKSNQIHSRDLNEDEQELFNQTRLWDWKNKNINQAMVKAAIIKNTDEYRKFSKAVRQTVKELSSKSSTHEYYLETMYSALCIPEEFSKQLLTNILHGLDNWDQWHGNLISSCFDTKKASKVESELVNLAKSSGSGLVDKCLQDIITHVKTKLEL